MKIRSSGILLPVSSLPSVHGIGDIGPEANRFVDFLEDAGQTVWQVLPINPTLAANSHSPYHSPSAFAFNPLLISPALLLGDGLLEKADLTDMPIFSTGTIDYNAGENHKHHLLQKAFARFRPDQKFADFCATHAHWLDDYALFTALTNHYKQSKWHLWPKPIRNREPDALRTASRKLSDTIFFIRFVQYQFYKQWRDLKQRSNAKGISIMGDLPIYAPHESADTWAHPYLFKLDSDMRPTAVSGVPPDYFSATGQHWGHPVYRWQMHVETGFDWWIRRIRHNLDLFDHLRIDHFRGLVAYWEIPAGQQTAVKGKWIKAPARQFFTALFKQFPYPPIIAEDLGYITADVREVVREYDIPGMRVLVFGFDENPGANPNAPHNIDQNCVVYTGTHDTNTARGWFEEEAGESGRKRVFSYFGRHMTAVEFTRELIRTAFMSRARRCIIPMQDLLCLGSEARINRPGSPSGNWRWQLEEGQIDAVSASRLREMTKIFGRT